MQTVLREILHIGKTNPGVINKCRYNLSKMVLRERGGGSGNPKVNQNPIFDV